MNVALKPNVTRLAETVAHARKVTYSEVKPALWDTSPSLQQPTVTFIVEYTMDTQDFWDLCRAFFAVAIVLTSLTGLWRLRNWHVRTNRYEPPAALVVGKSKLFAP